MPPSRKLSPLCWMRALRLPDRRSRNAEKMKNPDGTPFTAHTTNVVPFVAIGCGDVKLREGGCLADIAPTMLPYIGLPVPAEMSGKSIIVE